MISPSNTIVPDAVTDHLRRLGVLAADLAAAKSHSLHDGNDEVALIIRAGGLIAVCDFTRNAIRIYNQRARQVGMVTMSCDHPPL